MIQTILLFIVSLLVVIVVHEMGHFIASKRVGVAVEEFGLGFPPRIYGRMWRGTLYSINALPVGAFVRSRGENDPSMEGSLAGQTAWRRLVVYAAGPLSNIVLAFLLFTTFFVLPRGVAVSDGVIVYSVADGSGAQQAGLLPGDVIVSAGGAKLEGFGDLQEVLSLVSSSESVSLDVLRAGARLSMLARPSYSQTLGRNVIGITLARNIVVDVEPGSLAEGAGVRTGDSLLAVNGRGVVNEADLEQAVSDTTSDANVVITLLRGNDTTYAVELTRTQLESQSLGVGLRWAPNSRIERRGISLGAAALASSRYIVAMPALIVASVPLMRDDPSLAFVGPIGAGQLTVEAVQIFGPSNLIFIAGLISIGIALFNLIPIPPLDGGGILVALIEAARRGKRLSERAVRVSYAVGTSVLIMLVILITTSDLMRLIQGRGFGL